MKYLNPLLPIMFTFMVNFAHSADFEFFDISNSDYLETYEEILKRLEITYGDIYNWPIEEDSCKLVIQVEDLNFGFGDQETLRWISIRSTESLSKEEFVEKFEIQNNFLQSCFKLNPIDLEYRQFKSMTATYSSPDFRELTWVLRELQPLVICSKILLNQ